MSDFCHWALFALTLAAAAGTAPAPAPAPAKKAPQAKAPPHVGAWHLAWGYGTGEVVFTADGGYWCLWNGGQWLGHWRLDGGRLTVEESRILGGVPGAPDVWEVELDEGGLTGKLSRGGNFALSRPAPTPGGVH